MFRKYETSAKAKPMSSSAGFSLTKKSNPQRKYFRPNLRNLFILATTLLVAFINNPGVKGNPVPDNAFQQIKWPSWTTDTRDNNNNQQSWIPQTKEHHNYFSDEDDDFDDMGSSIESIAIGVGIFILVSFIVTCLVCFCCPICIIAKMRQRRRGQVYRTTIVTNSNGNANTRNNTGQPPVTTALHVQNSVAPNTNSAVNCIAIANNSNNRNSPYPVQESVTVVPVISAQQQQPQQHQPPYYGQGHQQSFNNQPPYGYQQNSPYPMPMVAPAQNDLPPPYPGLPREMDSSNLPYNPYFPGDEASGGNPSAPPSAPYPTKQ